MCREQTVHSQPNLTTAVAIVDQNILISCLVHWTGIKCAQLDWFRSRLDEEIFCVCRGDFVSVPSLSRVVCTGIGPWSSTFLLYLGFIPRNHGISFDFYMDDGLIDLPQNFLTSRECLNDIKTWMSLYYYYY